MPGPDPSRRSAYALLGLAEGADRDAVIHAYHRLARATHPDVSDAPDAAARFVALTAAYGQVLEGTGSIAAPAPSTVRITVHPPHDRPSLIDPPIVAGPVRIVPTPPRGSGRSAGRGGRR